MLVKRFDNKETKVFKLELILSTSVERVVDYVLRAAIALVLVAISVVLVSTDAFKLANSVTKVATCSFKAGNSVVRSNASISFINLFQATICALIAASAVVALAK